jgi:hypothetical protein
LELVWIGVIIPLRLIVIPPIEILALSGNILLSYNLWKRCYPNLLILEKENEMPLINGAHSIIYSKKPEADRVFLRDIMGLSHVDVGDGWLIFGLPASELAVHPSSKNNKQELYFMCKDIHAFIKTMKGKKVTCSSIQSQAWGELTYVTLPGGGKLGVYQPHHARPKASKQRTTSTSRRPTPRKTS